MVTLENYEEYIVLLVDGELDAAGQKELEAFMQLHPELSEELDMYENVRLTPDTTLVFENKESLLRKEPKVIALNQWFRYSAAAGLALLIALGVMKWTGDDTNNNIAVTDTVEHRNTEIAKSVDTAVSAPEQEEEVIAKEEEAPKKEKSVVPVVHTQKTEVADVKEERKRVQVDVPERLEIAAVNRLSADRNKPSGHEAIAVPALPKTHEPAPIQPEHEALAWLPISEDRREGLSMIGDAITARVEKVKEVRDNIKNTDLAVKLGKKEIFTIRF